MFTYLLIHLFIHSFVRPLINSFVRSFIHSFIKWKHEFRIPATMIGETLYRARTLHAMAINSCKDCNCWTGCRRKV